KTGPERRRRRRPPSRRPLLRQTASRRHQVAEEDDAVRELHPDAYTEPENAFVATGGHQDDDFEPFRTSAPRRVATALTRHGPTSFLPQTRRSLDQNIEEEGGGATWLVSHETTTRVGR
ncbi:unnamed protein product, partial [Urochloa humidicola]